MCQAEEYEAYSPDSYLCPRGVCVVWTTCIPGMEYESRSPTAFRDRQCTEVATCSDGLQYQTTTLTVTSNRVSCETYSVCPDTTHNETQACTPLTAEQRVQWVQRLGAQLLLCIVAL